MTISETGGTIQTSDPSKVGSYTCTIKVTSQPLHLAVNSSFTFPLKIITVPDPPTAFNGIATSSSVAFSWTPPIKNGESAVIGYDIYQDPGQDLIG